LLFKHLNSSNDYGDGQVVVPQGSVGQIMGLVEKGHVEVFQKTVDGDETVYRVLESGETFGVDSLFRDEPRRTGIRALGKARVAIMDRRDFIRRTQETPQLAFTVLQSVCLRISEMDKKMHDSRHAGNPDP